MTKSATVTYPAIRRKEQIVFGVVLWMDLIGFAVNLYVHLHYLFCSVVWVRSLARIKVSAFGAEDRGFKSLRTRFKFSCNCCLKSHIRK